MLGARREPPTLTVGRPRFVDVARRAHPRIVLNLIAKSEQFLVAIAVHIVKDGGAVAHLITLHYPRHHFRRGVVCGCACDGEQQQRARDWQCVRMCSCTHRSCSGKRLESDLAKIYELFERFECGHVIAAADAECAHRVLLEEDRNLLLCEDMAVFCAALTAVQIQKGKQ